MKDFIIKKRCGFVPKVGNRIHLRSRNGHYEIVELRKKDLVITCQIWQAREGYPIIPIVKIVPYKDIKSLHRH